MFPAEGEKMKIVNYGIRKMEIETVYASDCCGAYLSDAHVEHGICPECAEHCEVCKEEILATPVCGG